MVFINKNNNVLFRRRKLIIDLDDELFLFPLEEIRTIAITTTEKALLNQNVFMSFETAAGMFVMGITHPDFMKVMTPLCKIADVDDNLLIDAMQSQTQQSFILYKGRN